VHKKIFKLLAVQLIFLFFAAISFFNPPKIYAVDASTLGRDIDQFLSAGAQGYFVWQYGGDFNGRKIAVDQFSFYRDVNQDICETLKSKAEQYPDKTIGVNINNIGANEFKNDGVAVEHMTWLKENCGVSAIRVFGKIDGLEGIGNALSAGEQSGVKILVSIGDYSNGGGGIPQGADISWYESGYKGGYKTFVNRIVQSYSNHPALFGFELANEPHCGGDGNAISAYTAWGADIGAILRNATPNVGYGQMASQNGTRCDSPVPGDYAITNNINAITMASAHFYTEEEKQNALLALNISGGLGKMFYIGEAPPGELSTEETSGESGYDNSIYPEYGVDDSLAYIAPIRNVIDGANDPSLVYSVPTLRRELASQGYQAYCASDNVEIKPDYNTEELINKYFDLVDKGMPEVAPENRFLEIESVESLSTQNAKYPLWRDVSNKQFLMTSLEEYFGFKDIYIQDASKTVLTSSAINSLLSEPQMCLQGWKNLVAQELACERLDPGSWEVCDLFTRPIPGTKFTVKSLLTELSEYEPTYAVDYPGYREGGAKQGCISLIKGDRNKSKDLQEMYQGLLNTPTYFDRAYRYGFIVAAIHTKNIGPEKENSAMKIFNFFSEPTKLQEPTDEVLVVAFKLPDIGTNHWQAEDNGVQFWDDPLSLTRKLLSNSQQNATHELEKRDQTAKDILKNATLFSGNDKNADKKIFCTTATEDDQGRLTGGVSTASCKNYLTKALTDIINGNAGSCGEAEAVNVIKDIASLNTTDIADARDGRLFNVDNGVEVILNLFKGDITHPVIGDGQAEPQKADTKDPADKLFSIFDITKEKWNSRNDEPTTVDFYVVYPMGFELNAVEEAMKGAFFTKAQLEFLAEQQTNDSFEMSGVGIGLSSNSKGFSYEDEEATKRGECGTETITSIIPGSKYIDEDGYEITVASEIVKEEVNIKCNRNISVTVKQEGAGVGILGAKLGFWMKQVQKQISSRTGEAWSYFNSCATTEDFMLGRCQGGSNGLGSGGDYLSETCGYTKPGTGYCSPEYLRPFFQEAGLPNPDKEAEIASRICQRESNSKPTAFNSNCIKGTSVDYSVGLFQINMLPRCPGSFKDATGTPDTASGYNPFARDENELQTCTIVDQERLNECFLDKLVIDSDNAGVINQFMPEGSSLITIDTDEDVIKQKADESIRAMVQIRKSWDNWNAWVSSDCQK